MTSKPELWGKLIGGLIAPFVSAAIDRLLWNWQIGPLFHLPNITFWQAWAMTILLMSVGMLVGKSWKDGQRQ